jgi:hypothetical protein
LIDTRSAFASSELRSLVRPTTGRSQRALVKAKGKSWSTVDDCHGNCYLPPMFEIPPRSAACDRLRGALESSSLAATGRKLGLSTEAVRRWAMGLTKPRPEHREQLERLLGIPAASWDEPALTELPAAEPAPKKRRTRRAA